MNVQLSAEIQAEIVRRIVASVRPSKVVLFGSYANGTSTEFSDLDILVVKQNVSSKFRESLDIENLLSDIPLPKDILVTSEAEYEFYKKEAGSVFRTAFENGRELYAR